VSGIVDASEAGVRVQWALAILLALIAGYLDGYGVLFLGVYVSFMSGHDGCRLKEWSGQFSCRVAFRYSRLFFCNW
jgi:hypothetical protein